MASEPKLWAASIGQTQDRRCLQRSGVLEGHDAAKSFRGLQSENMARMGCERKEGGVMFGLNDDIHEYRDEIAGLKSTVAELVALLRMGRELSEASVDAVWYSGSKKGRAVEDRDRILGQYDAAIAKHGGAACPDA